MKKACCALLLAALMAAAPAGAEELTLSPAAEEQAAGEGLSLSAKAAASLGSLSPMVESPESFGFDFYSLGKSRGILPELWLPKDATLTSYPVPSESLSGAAGLLTMKGKSYDAFAQVFGFEMSGPEADDTFGGMFVPGGFTPEAGQKMLHFNMALLKTEGALNDLFLTVLKGTREATGELIPYDFLAVDMVQVEQLHRVKDDPKTYSFAMEPYLAVDGFAVPLYLRGFASKSENGYRLLLFVTLDSFQDRLNETTYQIISHK